MKFNINKVYLILIFFFPIVFDLLYGFLNSFLKIDIPISSMYRTLLLLFLVPFLFYLKQNIINIYIQVTTFLFIILYFIWLLVFNNDYITREVQQYIRIIYPYIILVFLAYLYQKNKFNKQEIIFVLNLIVFSGLLASLSIYFSFFTGYGLKTYGEYTFATSSFFKAQNDITLSLLLSLNTSMYLFFTFKKKYIFYALIILGAFPLLGTRAGTLGSILLIVSYLILTLLMKRDIVLSLFFKIVISIFLLFSITFFSYKLYQVIEKYPYLIEKYMLILEESPRAKLELAGLQVMEEQNPIAKVFGEGSVLFGKSVENFYPSHREYPFGKFVEQDILDMYGSYGYILGSLFLFFPLYILLKSIKLFFLKRDIHSFFLIMGMSFFIGHAFFAGHALNSPTVASFIVIIYFLVLYHQKIKGFK